MATVERVEDIKAWQKARELIKEVYVFWRYLALWNDLFKKHAEIYISNLSWKVKRPFFTLGGWNVKSKPSVCAKFATTDFDKRKHVAESDPSEKDVFEKG